jgi:K+-sensing histidine kinase KdpD
LLLPPGFITTAVLVLQALTLVVQFVMTAVVVIFHNKKTASRAESETPALREGTEELGQRNNKKRRVPRPSIGEIPFLPLRYLLAPLSVAVALITSLLVRRSLHISHPLAWFLAAVVISVWYGGRGPGLVAMTLSVLAIVYFILPSLHSLVAGPSDEVWYLVGFVFWSLLISWFSSKRRGAEQALRQVAIAWQKRWQGTAELIEKNAQLQREITELRERIGKLEQAIRQRGSLSA